jgi:hypothetical protein
MALIASKPVESTRVVHRGGVGGVTRGGGGSSTRDAHRISLRGPSTDTETGDAMAVVTMTDLGGTMTDLGGWLVKHLESEGDPVGSLCRVARTVVVSVGLIGSSLQAG